jgi:hypothetical protein
MSELTLEFVIDQENELIKGLSSDSSNMVVATFIRDLFIELKQRRESDLRPADKFLGAKEFEQYAHVFSEFEEFKISFLHYWMNKCDDEKLHTIEELIDLQMSCETMIAILGLDEQQRREARCKVIEKNRARGYYEVAK